MGDSEKEAEQDKQEVDEVEQKRDRNKGLLINDVITRGGAGRGGGQKTTDDDLMTEEHIFSQFMRARGAGVDKMTS